MRHAVSWLIHGFGLLGLLLCITPVVDAAPPPPPLVAVILPRDNARFQTIHTAFLGQFERITTVAGKPRLYVQSPNPDVLSLRNSMRKAVALGADLVVVYGTRATMAAVQEDFTEPLIFADVFEPVAMGLVPENGRGGNLVTGVCGHAPVQTLLKVLQEMMGTRRLGIPVEPKNPAGKAQVEVLRKAACRKGAAVGAKGLSGKGEELCWLEVVPAEMPTPAALAKSLKAVIGRIDTIYLSDLLPSDVFVQEGLAFAAQVGLPVVGQIPGLAEQGALITLESDPVEQGELLADVARRIIDGDLPEYIAPPTPRKVSLVINLKTARELGVQVPFSVLTQADRVIR